MKLHINAKTPKKSQSNRRGATLVLVAIVMTVVVSFVALGLDFSRMYSFKSELKRSADAAALGVVLDKVEGRTLTTAEGNTFSLNAFNKVDGSHVPILASQDIHAVHWSFDSASLSDVSWTAATANGARVSVSYSADWTLGRVFASGAKVLHDTTYAAFGSLITSSCLKPIAIPYLSLLAKLSPPQTSTSWSLTQDDVRQLNDAANSIKFIDYNKADGEAGNFGWVDVSPGAGGSKNDHIAAALEPGACASGATGVGMNLQGITGNRATFQDAFDRLCGGVWTGQGNSAEMLCTGPAILVPIYDTGNGQNGNNALFHVKYIGAFRLYKQDNKDIYGYLTSLTVPPSGALSNAPGPVMSAVIVK